MKSTFDEDTGDRTEFAKDEGVLIISQWDRWGNKNQVEIKTEREFQALRETLGK